MIQKRKIQPVFLFLMKADKTVLVSLDHIGGKNDSTCKNLKYLAAVSLNNFHKSTLNIFKIWCIYYTIYRMIVNRKY